MEQHADGSGFLPPLIPLILTAALSASPIISIPAEAGTGDAPASAAEADSDGGISERLF